MVQLSLTGLDYQKLYFGMDSMKSMAWETLQKFFPLFKIVINVFKAFKIFAPCLKNEAANQLKANVFLLESHSCFPKLYTLLSCLYTLWKALTPHLYGLWYYKLMKTYIHSICN